MQNIGFIGYGSMGSMLVKGFIESGKVCQENIFVTRKDKNKLVEIKNSWPEINDEQEVADVIKKSKYIFICIKPMEYKALLNEIKSYIRPEQHIVSIAGSILIEDLEKITDCKITKLMPTVIMEVNNGISLVCHNRKVTSEDAEFIETLIGSISKIQITDEKDFDSAANLTSCGPGLIAAVFQELAEAALRNNDSLKEEDIVEMIQQTLYGTSKMMLVKKMSFKDVISRVSTKGGITEEGVMVIQKDIPNVFDEMFSRITDKREVVNDKMHKEFE